MLAELFLPFGLEALLLPGQQRECRLLVLAARYCLFGLRLPRRIAEGAADEIPAASGKAMGRLS